MDFGIRNPVAGHSSHVDDKGRQWGGVDADIFSYLSDISNLEQFADMAQNADQLAQFLDPFLDNAETYFEAMQKLVDGQVTWTELRKKFGSKVANAIAKIRKLNGEFDAEMDRVDAQDRADLLRIEQKRKHGLTEIAVQLQYDLESELWRHENKINTIETRKATQQERQTIQTGLRQKRQELLDRAKHGTGRTNPEKVPVQTQDSSPSSGVSATGTNRGWGENLSNLWDRLGNR